MYNNYAHIYTITQLSMLHSHSKTSVQCVHVLVYTITPTGQLVLARVNPLLTLGFSCA